MTAREKVRALALAAMAALFSSLAIPAAQAAPGDIVTVAGNGVAAYSGDGGPATAASLDLMSDTALIEPGGAYLIADKKNAAVRLVSRSGLISTVAGIGDSFGDGGEGIPATAVQLAFPTGIAVTPDGGFLIADSGNNRVRKVSPDGIATTVAGTGTGGYNGDGIPATSAQLNYPARVAPTSDGGFLIADFSNNRIRKVSASGIISTVAGSGTFGYNGDEIAAVNADLSHPGSVRVTRDGGFLIAEHDGQRIRRVSSDGVISTVAGNGVPGSGGDGGPATAAQLDSPADAAPTIDGGFLIAGYDNDAVRKVSPTGIITTVAGTGVGDFSGDGGPATAAMVDHPTSAMPMPDGGFLITDFFNHRVRRVLGENSPAICGPGLNVIVGADLNDELVGSDLADAISGRGGDDQLSGLGNSDCLLGEVGADSLDGGDGADRMFGAGGGDVLRGKAGRDRLSGQSGKDRLNGGSGKDRLGGAGGGDRLNGGKGRDRLAGGKGKDRLNGGKGKDRLNGGRGRDRLAGGGGRDIFRCGPGNDTVIADEVDRVAANCEKVR